MRQNKERIFDLTKPSFGSGQFPRQYRQRYEIVGNIYRKTENK